MAQSERQSRSACPRNLVTSIPLQRTRPLVGSVRRLIMRSKVDLPAPERPMMPTKLPAENPSVTSFTAVLAPNLLVTSSRLSIRAPAHASD